MQNKNKIMLIIALIIFGITFISCNEDKEEYNVKTEKSTKPHQKVLSDKQIDILQNRLRVGVPDEYLHEADGSGKFVLCTLFKKNKKGECRKFGICQWFPKSHFNVYELPERTVPCIIKKRRDNSLKPLIIELKEDVSKYPLEAYEFGISEDIIIEDEIVQELGLKKVILRAGIYQYDEKIGRFGGYIIPLYYE